MEPGLCIYTYVYKSTFTSLFLHVSVFTISVSYLIHLSMFTCLCLHICVYIFEFTYLCLHICAYMSMFTCLHYHLCLVCNLCVHISYISIYISIFICLFLHFCLNVCDYMSVFTCLCLPVCAYMSMVTSLCLHVSAYMSVVTSLSLHVYVYISMFPVHLVGCHDGRVFEDRDITFVVGEGSEVGVVDGVEQGVKKFKKGEKSILKVKSKYGFGANGNSEFNIPPNADLHFEVELKKFEKVGV